jgi:hypothetical protein
VAEIFDRVRASGKSKASEDRRVCAGSPLEHAGHFAQGAEGFTVSSDADVKVPDDSGVPSDADVKVPDHSGVPSDADVKASDNRGASSSPLKTSRTIG